MKEDGNQVLYKCYLRAGPFWQLIRNKENEWKTKSHMWEHVKIAETFKLGGLMKVEYNKWLNVEFRTVGFTLSCVFLT